jgi:glycosyltransferase involved in cell wall biosynthesis
MLRIDQKIASYVCTNGFMKEKMIQYGFDSGKIQIIPTFFEETPESLKLRGSNIVDKKMVNFLFIGNIDEKKGIYDLLIALKTIKETRINFHLSIVGGLYEKDNEKVKEIIQESNLADCVSLIPWIKDKSVFSAYSNSNVTIIPTRWVENLPNTLIESIYFNRPVVVPDFGSFLYTTSDSVSFRFKALDVGSLCNVLTYILDHPDEIEQKSKNCPLFFKDNFSAQSHLQKLCYAFHNVITSK